MNTKKRISSVKRFFTFRSIGSKVVAALIVDTVVLGVLVLVLFSRYTLKMDEDLMLTKLKTDITYLEDIISSLTDAQWSIKDSGLYLGDVFIGDATEQNANVAPFYEAEEKTGTFVYTFMKVSDEGLTWTGDSKTGYQQGHFIRVAGTTKGPNGQSLVGTYIDKKVADVLDEKGEYSGVANVGGGMIFCYYKVLTDSSGEVIGAMVVGRSMAEIQKIAASAGTSIIVLIILVIVLGGVGLFVVIRKWTKNVEKVEHYLKKIGTGALPEDKLQLKTRDEISEVADCVNDMVDSLRDKERMGAELSVASNIQANLLPKVFPPYPNRDDFELFASMDPAKEVGGDLYDFFMVDWNHLAIVIADVSGKGVPASLFMVTAKTLIKDQAMLGLHPGEVFTRVNTMLCEGNVENLFVTAWMCVIELSSGKVEFANAGHNPPLIMHDGEFEYLKSPAGLVLAGMVGINYKTQQFELKKNDVLYLYTDGVTESTNTENELYGEDRLKAYLNAHKDDDVETLCKGVRKDAEDFTGEAPQFDDVTMAAFRYFGGTDQHEIITEAKIENIPKITEFVDAELEKMGCTMKAETQINIAIDEVISNIAQYAYKNNSGVVKVNIVDHHDDDKIGIKFIDGGFPYNPLEREAPDVTASVEDRAIGGLGIHIVKNIMDEVKYRYDNNKNILILVKTIK